MGAQVFSGNVRIAYVDQDGALLKGYLPIVNAIKLAINTPEPTLLTQISHKRDDAGQALDEIAIKKPTEVETSIDDVADPRILAWSVNGVVTAINQTNTAVTADSNVAQLDQWVQVASKKRNLSSFALKDSTGTTTFTPNVDYVFDPIAGFWMAKTGGAITDLESVKEAYTPATLTGSSIAVNMQPFNLLRIDGDMVGLGDGRRAHVVVPKYKCYASGALDLLEITKLTIAALKGKALVLPGQAPATIDYYT